jgi:hypothetical protein
MALDRRAIAVMGYGFGHNSMAVFGLLSILEVLPYLMRNIKDTLYNKIQALLQDANFTNVVIKTRRKKGSGGV